MLSMISMLPTSPIPSRSSGTNDNRTPNSRICMGVLSRKSSVFSVFGSKYKISPCVTRCNPAIASKSSLCPLPAIPAIPKISPPNAWNETSLSTNAPSRLLQHKWSTCKRLVGFTGCERVIFSSTFLPTIISVNLFSLVCDVSTVPM